MQFVIFSSYLPSDKSRIASYDLKSYFPSIRFESKADVRRFSFKKIFSLKLEQGKRRGYLVL